MAAAPADSVAFTVNGGNVEVPPTGSLLDALREHIGIRSAKDGCSPQGQCGCCTVWVDGQARVSCVTPVARVRGREVTTVEGLADAHDWAVAFSEGGASQCGFCTTGIIMRVAAMDAAKRSSPDAVRQAMLAHMCRCTGWNPIVDTVVDYPTSARERSERPARESSELRAELEGGVAQTFGPQVALGRGGFADDTAPDGALVALRGVDGEWVVGTDLQRARELSGKVQGRRTTAPLSWPVALPEGDWARTLRDDLGRTRLPRAGRIMVRAGRGTDEFPWQRRSVRWQELRCTRFGRAPSGRRARHRGPSADHP